MRRVSPAEFVLAHTSVRHAPFVPELRLHLADDSLELWDTTQVAVDRGDVPPPFWAFVWAGGQALARHLLDTELARGQVVVDLATGSGIVALAAARSSAASVTAYDVDDLSVAAARLNARTNGLEVDVRTRDVRDVEVEPGTLVTVGDVFYDEKVAAAMRAALGRLVDAGAEVLVGDPHRAYLPRDLLDVVAEYDVEVEPDIEDAPVKPTLIGWLRRPTGVTSAGGRSTPRSSAG